MELWIARQKSGYLQVFNKKPIKTKEGAFMLNYGQNAMAVPQHLFPEITNENSPKRIECKLVE